MSFSCNLRLSTSQSKSSIIVEPDKYYTRNNIADIFLAPTKNVNPSRKYPIYFKKWTKIHYEGSEAPETDHYQGDKDTEHKKNKE